MKILRIVAAMVAGVMTISAGTAWGAEYPNKTVRLITTSAGGGSDLMARMVAQGIAPVLGQPVIVENRAGGGTIPGEIVARASPDGYTLLFAAGTLWISTLLRKAPYDPIRDFAPITMVANTPNLLIAHPSVASSVKELIAVAKAKPGQLNYGTGATGASSHLAAELFKHMAGVNMTRIPYKGSGIAVAAVMGNEVQIMFPNVSLAVPHVKAGKLKALGITSSEPSGLLPGVPTIAASGLPGYESVLYNGLFAPTRTPAAVVRQLNQVTVKFLQTPEAREWFLKTGSDAVGSTPEQFGAKIKSEMVRLGKLIKEVGIREE